MCGIAGFLKNEEIAPQDAERLRAMTRTLVHRGPDGEGFFLSGNVGLGHRRLAVIDLNTGDQPMSSADGSLTITFNGEIYNYLELREELLTHGHLFRTSSDTEIILASYRQWGERCVEHLNGMWAFALWDVREQRLFCSRDRVGEKPFYYCVADGVFIFGSEIKAILAYGVPRVVNVEALDAYLCFAYIPGRQTFFKGIYKLQPAHSIVVKDGNVRESPYWELDLADEDEARTDEKRVLEEFAHLFEESVAIRMRSDVPFGAFLSGGLDSSCVVGVMSSLSKEPVRTCTIGFNQPDFDERALARLVAVAFKTNHVERVVNPDDSENLLPTLAWHFDEPFGDPSALPTYLVAKVARERVTMALTGDGGDEVCSGYTIHVGEKIASLYSCLPGFAKKAVAQASSSFVVRNSNNQALVRAERVARSCGLDFEDRLESKQIGFTRTERASLIRLEGVRPAREYIEETIEPVRHKSNFVKLNYWLTKAALPDDMLCKVDRTSMAHSLETRTPFLDYRIVELMGKTSMRIKLQGFQRKSVLRETVAKNLPSPLLTASKRGFSVPLNSWLQGGALESVERKALGAGDGGVLCLDSIKRILAAHKSGNRETGNAIWALSMLAGQLS
jgi:asparagine synthase (glutamine-hydrolysing)